MAPAQLLRFAAVVLIIFIARPSATGQSPSAKERELRRKNEDALARLFETLRAKGELQPLTRIVHRKSLQELVCTAASLDAPVWKQNSPGALMYRTGNQTSSNSDLEGIARFKDQFQTKDQPTFTRYAVAVWPSSAPESGQPAYWVGIQVYMSAFWEFFDNNFTDNRPYRDEWKKLVAPPCRGID
jgi:hypothetical protein